MDNQHKKISGYRDLSESEIALMNEIKAFEAQWNGLVDRLRGAPGLDQRQVALAATVGEEAFMRAVRAVAQPQRIVDDKGIEPVNPRAEQVVASDGPDFDWRARANREQALALAQGSRSDTDKPKQIVERAALFAKFIETGEVPQTA